MVQADVGNNLLVEAVLRLLYKLVRCVVSDSGSCHLADDVPFSFSFGFYVAPEDIAALMKPLTSIADGTNDVLDNVGCPHLSVICLC